MKDRSANRDLETSSDQWTTSSFYELASITSGQVDPKKAPYRDMVLVAPDHIRSGTGRLDTRQTAMQQAAISGKYLVKPTEIIYSKIRPNLRKIAIADEECLCSADMYPIRAKPGISPKFLMYLILSKPFTEFATAASARSGLPKINRDELAFFEAKVPVDERKQQAIAEALSDADGVVEGLERLIEKKRRIKQGAMQDLLTAKRRLPGFSGEWQPLNLASHSHLKARIGWQGLTTQEYKRFGEHILVTGTDILGGRVNWNGCVFVDKWRYDQDRNIQLRNDDILITKDGTIGKVALVTDMPGPAALNSGVFVIRPIKNEYHPGFAFHILSSSVFDEFLDRLTAGSTIIHLYQKDLVTFQFFAPNYEEQAAISKVLDNMDTEITALETRLQKARAIKEGMMQNLLTGRIRLV